ncbi:hypothetical protein [Massilia niastensis]|uniref:hypothetical protein n=1 Tax=Massilia niastensis TaxID=544911 RepID=UPI0003A1723C|nr:hypothetical protein [Massilia niastensis]
MKALLATLLTLALALPACASPGAHGPNGEHLDGPAATATVGTVPRIETFSELFELVGHLSGGELSILVDRYETNEPVLNGKLEVEYQGQKANAKFHADLGDYSIDEPKLLKALSAPGKHALLFTFVSGDESDLLEGTLEVSAVQVHGHEHGGGRAWLWLAAAITLLLAIAAIALVRRSKLVSGK